MARNESQLVLLKDLEQRDHFWIGQGARKMTSQKS